MHVLTDLKHASQNASRGASNGRLLARGFAIVELPVVTVVIAILAAISIVPYVNIQAMARDASPDAAVRQLRTAIDSYRVDKGHYPHTCLNDSGKHTDGLSCFSVSLERELAPGYLTSLPNVLTDDGERGRAVYVADKGRDGYGISLLYESREHCRWLGRRRREESNRFFLDSTSQPFRPARTLRTSRKIRIACHYRRRLKLEHLTDSL